MCVDAHALVFLGKWRAKAGVESVSESFHPLELVDSG